MFVTSCLVSYICVYKMCIYYSLCGVHQDLHVLTPSFPTQRSSDLPGPYPRFSSSQPGVTGGGWRAASASRPGKSRRRHRARRSEEHTSELQSLMRISYAVFCLKKKKNTTAIITADKKDIAL